MKLVMRKKTVGDDVSVCQEVLDRYPVPLFIATGGMDMSASDRQVSGRGFHGFCFLELVQEPYDTWSWCQWN